MESVAHDLTLGKREKECKVTSAPYIFWRVLHSSSVMDWPVHSKYIHCGKGTNSAVHLELICGFFPHDRYKIFRRYKNFYALGPPPDRSTEEDKETCLRPREDHLNQEQCKRKGGGMGTACRQLVTFLSNYWVQKVLELEGQLSISSPPSLIRKMNIWAI